MLLTPVFELLKTLCAEKVKDSEGINPFKLSDESGSSPPTVRTVGGISEIYCTICTNDDLTESTSLCDTTSIVEFGSKFHVSGVTSRRVLISLLGLI